MASSARFALLLLLLATLSVAVSGTLVRLSEVGPVATAMWRMALAIPAVALLLPFSRQEAGKRISLSRQDLALMAASGILFGAEIGIWHIALMMTSVTNATLLSNCSPLIVALGSWIILRQKLSGTFLAGMALAMVGATILMGESFSLSLIHFWGDALSLFAAVLFGLYILCIAKLRERLSTPRILVWTCFFGAVALLPFPFVLGETIWPETLRGWTVVAAIALFCQVAGQGLLAAALAHLPATFSSVAFLVVPFNAALIAWAVLGEPVRLLQAVGASVVLLGVALARKGSR